MTTNTPMPRDTAVQKLDQINRWKAELPDAHADLVGLRSTWQVGGLHGSLAADVPMPHGLDAVFDDVDSWGAQGIRTEVGVNEMLESLASMAGGYCNREPSPYAAWWLRELLCDYSEEFWHAWAEWETFTTELSQVHGVVARLCGRSSVTVSLCPECGGKIKARMTDEGKSDEGKCASCGEKYDLSGPDWDIALLERLRSPEISRSVLVTRAQVKTIWPQVRAGTIRNWRYLQKISKPAIDGRLILAEINAMMC